jgi:hypothetical protein
MNNYSKTVFKKVKIGKCTFLKNNILNRAYKIKLDVTI